MTTPDERRRSMTPGAERVRRYRERERRKCYSYRIDVHRDAINILIALGRLSEAEAARPKMVSEVLSSTFAELMEILKKRTIL